MIRTALSLAAAAVGVTAAIAQSDPVAQRKALMKANVQNFGAINKMAKGEDPFDVAKVNAAFVAWSETAQKLPGLFPQPPQSGETTRALPNIATPRSRSTARSSW